jgi:heme oxygenase
MTKNTTDLVNDSIVQEFQGLIDQGNDFFKIELLRPAKKCYKKALELNIDQEEVQQKIAECDRLLTFEKRVVWILSAIMAAAILLWILFK